VSVCVFVHINSDHFSLSISSLERFKTQAGRDLAVQRSGEALGPYCSWWNPEDVAVVLRGRDEDISGGGGGTGLNDLMVVLPQGRSIADVLEQVCRVYVCSCLFFVSVCQRCCAQL